MIHDHALIGDLLAFFGNGASKNLFCRLFRRGMRDLIKAELIVAIGAARHERADSRSNQHNGLRPRGVVDPVG